jgi:hypothetical protein
MQQAVLNIPAEARDFHSDVEKIEEAAEIPRRAKESWGTAALRALQRAGFLSRRAAEYRKNRR